MVCAGIAAAAATSSQTHTPSHHHQPKLTAPPTRGRAKRSRRSRTSAGARRASCSCVFVVGRWGVLLVRQRALRFPPPTKKRLGVYSTANSIGLRQRVENSLSLRQSVPNALFVTPPPPARAPMARLLAPNGKGVSLPPLRAAQARALHASRTQTPFKHLPWPVSRPTRPTH